MFYRLCCCLALSCVILSCSKDEVSPPNKFSDPVIVKIYEFKDRRLSDSLYQYFSHDSATYRLEAALAFASIQDTIAITPLIKRFMIEPDTTVRKVIAFSLGQMPSSHTERVLLGAIIKEKNHSVLRELLESYGKTTDHWQLVQPKLLADTINAQSIAWSIYRAGLNGKTDTSANRVALSLIQRKHHLQTQLGAAHFFARGATDFERAKDVLINTTTKGSSAEIRMAAAIALRKITEEQSLETLLSIAGGNDDARVRVNAIRALSAFPFADTKATLFEALFDQNRNIAVATSETIKNMTGTDWVELSNLTGRVQNWRVQANLYEAAFANTDNKSLVNEVKAIYKQSRNPFQKAALLSALQADVSSFDFVAYELNNADTAVIKSAAASTLLTMAGQKDFTRELKSKFVELCKAVFVNGDAAVIGTLSQAFTNEELKFKSIVTNHHFLKDARAKLSLPKDNEAIQPLEQAIAFFEDRKPAPISNEFNNPIDWEFVKAIPKNQRAIIKTMRGKIILSLFVEEAPGSVANFIKLAKADYFDQKVFHRVVPNFVIQAGCNRGDGWGSEDYSIRSEFSTRRYKTGSVGMASAGKDTEGTQWFITHSPTPHLDGRYTIFAEVIEGMTAVEAMEVGDKIIDVEIEGSKK